MAARPIRPPGPLAFPSLTLVNIAGPAFSKASILIIVLWVLCLLSTFAVISGYGARQKLSLVGRLEERDKLRYIAEAGAKKALAELKNEPLKSYDAFRDRWSNNPAAFANIAVADGWATVSYEYFDGAAKAARIQYGLIDEERKININKAEPEILERLFRIVLAIDEQAAKELAAAIVDWRDSDGKSADTASNAEDSYYMNLEYSYEAKDADFEVLEEVLLVKGMDSSLFQKLKDYLTIYGDGKVNINTASATVLLALGLSDELADKILSYRSGEDRELGTADDNVFDSGFNIVPLLSQAFHFSDSQVAQLSSVAAKSLGVCSSNFVIRSAGRLPPRKAASEVTCVADRQGKILYWQAR